MRSLFFVPIFFFLLSCRKDIEGFPQDLAVELSRTQATLNLRDTLKLYVKNVSQKVSKDSIRWTVDNKNVLAVLAVKGDTILLKPRIAGQAKISVKIRPLSFETNCTINVEEGNLIRVLAIGNSFSEDALEQNFYQMASASGKKLIVGNLFYAGAGLDFHVNSAKLDNKLYSYRKISSSGERTVTEGFSLKNAILDDYWDYISFQQKSDDSGLYDTFKNDLPDLFTFVNTRNDRRSTKYVLHQTWSYSPGSIHTAFAKYNNDSYMMYQAIASAYERAQTELLPGATVIPNGTSIQNYRQHLPNTSLTRDGQHLNTLGRYIAAGTWYYSLLDEKMTTSLSSLYRASGVSVSTAQQVELAITNALRSPFKTTDY